MNGLAITLICMALSIPVCVVMVVWLFTRYRPVALRDGERVVKRAHAFINLDNAPAGRNGELILTTQRLLWTPVRHFNLFPVEPQSLEFDDIESHGTGERPAKTLWMSRPLIVKDGSHSLEFYFGGNPWATFVTASAQREWNDLLCHRLEGRSHVDL